jgi:putative transposase
LEKWKQSSNLRCSSRRLRRRLTRLSFAEDGEGSLEVNHDLPILSRSVTFVFITASTIEWKHLFITHEYALIPLNSLAWMQQQNRILVFAYVVMPSHLHAIIKPVTGTIAEIIQQFGSFTSHEILKKLREQSQKDLLNIFQQKRRDQRHKHSIWQDIQAKNIYSMDFLQQKLEYIHQNPVAKEWKLVKDRADYPYSSARYYDYGRKPIIEITDINEWLTQTPSPRTAKRA